MNAQPFRINVPQTLLDDLQERLARTRWPDEVEGAGWDYGTNLDYMKELADYWQHQYDWRKYEKDLNTFRHFKTDIDGFGVHFIHERGKGPNPIPLLLLHGWPDSFYRFYKIIPMLTDPEKYGGKAEDSFDVIVPSLPGFGFSDRPKVRGWKTMRDAALFGTLMTDVLGYERYAAHGGDGGSPISQALARAYHESVIGIHLTDIGWDKAVQIDPSTLSEPEQRYMNKLEQSSLEEVGYIMIQGSRPQTLGYGLNDSPVGLAAWIVEKFRAWSDCKGDVEQQFTKDELLTNIMIYWITETINSSIRGYYEGMHAGWSEADAEQGGEWEKSSDMSATGEVPVGLALFPKDNPPPREMTERFFNVRRFTEMPTGGHFAALEEPDLLARDMRAFFAQLR